MPYLRKFQFISLALLLAYPGTTRADASLSSELKEFLSRVDSQERISTIVYLSTQATIKDLDQLLYESRSSRALRHEVVIGELRAVASATQPSVIETLEGLRDKLMVEDYTGYWLVNAFVVNGTREAIETIAKHPEVKWIDLNFRVRLIEPIPGRTRIALDENHGVPTGIRAVGARRVWYELGITGAGRLVGNIDTGVDGGHSALASRWRGLSAPASECWLDVIGNSQFPEDEAGHGTHVMGTICGNSTTSNDSTGIAPGAQWIACNAIGQPGGQAFNNDILAAYQWMADPDGNSATIIDVPDVVQNSWGVDGRFPGYSDCFQFWNDAIVNCEAAGVAVTFSAGNEGDNERTLRSPATIELDSVTFFSVGAVDANSDTIPPYTIANFSSRGPTDCPPFTAIKPEVCAPGVDVYSSLPGGNYGYLSGTSMAGPHVAGIIALMREANPNADVREMKSILMRTAEDFGEAGEDNDYGFGFVDAFGAVMEIGANRGVLRGYVTNVVTDDPIHLALVTARNLYTRRTDADGYFQFSLPGDSLWEMTVSAYGYEPRSDTIFLAIGDTINYDAALVPLPQGTLSGQVRAGADVPVEGATITFEDLPLPQLVADENGAFSIDLAGDTTYTVTVNFSEVEVETTLFVPVGTTTEVAFYLASVRSDQQGPDGYGYRAYDRWDHGIPPRNDWVEIAPARGGSGTVVTFQARDSSAFIAMPFPLQYYDATFDSLTINENGWLAAGISHDHSFFNYNIPALSGPSAMMAVCWDNLTTATGSTQVCYAYDSLNCRLIVEYYDARYSIAPLSRLTCQVHIYDVEAWPTGSGDCEIMFLYERVDILNSCTIGIESPLETQGLQLLYNESLGIRTWPIQAGSAILFTTRTEPRSTGTLSGTIITHPELADYGATTIQAGCLSIHPLANGTFSLNELFTGNRTVRASLPGHETIGQLVTIAEDSVSQQNFELWRLDPPRELQGVHTNDTVRLSWLPPESVGGSLDELREYVIYRDGAEISRTAGLIFVEPLPAVALFTYYIRANYDGGVSDTSNHVLIDGTVGTTLTENTVPREFALLKPYPNPFNSSLAFTLEIPHSTDVSISIFDITGRLSAVLSKGQIPAGVHRFAWRAEAQATGLYFLRVEADEFQATEKLMLIR